MLEAIELQEVPTAESFDEPSYLAANPDVAVAVLQRKFRSGKAHFLKFGRNEGRRQLTAIAGTPNEMHERISALRLRKLEKLSPLLSRRPLRGGKFGALNFMPNRPLDQDLLDEPEGVSENGYDADTVELIGGCADGLVLDVGAGRRPIYYGNVVNLELSQYVTTDVVGDAADLPFRDNSFDGVISIAVLEHVKNPFICAAEISRVIKPGGWLKCCVPFLQPLHGYPHHYFNMTHEGLRTLFEPHLEIVRQDVTAPLHPVWSISWQLRDWARALPEKSRKQFLRMRVEDLIGYPAAMLDEPFARDLPEKARFGLAAATLLLARKPDR
ncbi:MAG: class I SAM-dependent methyltransferase [Hyphomicrobiales bacterium]|nr:class I SAM-dependent methyltransferase [Hyphomicrobiales bacterium]